MSLLLWLLVAHHVGDYLFQTEYQALNKALGHFWNRALAAHCSIYTAVFLPVFWLFGVSFWWLAVIYSTHAVIDRRWPVLWWRRHVMRGSDSVIANTFWLTITVDQIFHLLVLVVIAGSAS